MVYHNEVIGIQNQNEVRTKLKSFMPPGWVLIGILSCLMLLAREKIMETNL